MRYESCKPNNDNGLRCIPSSSADFVSCVPSFDSSLDGLHDLRGGSIAEGNRLRQLSGLGAVEIPPETGSVVVGPAAVPELVAFRVEEHHSEAVLDAPDVDPELSGTLWGWPDTAPTVQVAG